MRNLRSSRYLTVVAGVAATSFAGGGLAEAETEVARPSTFTSAFTVWATPDVVYDADGKNVPGTPGASGSFNYMINSKEDVICYDITLAGVTPPYKSKAKTATHIHEGVPGVYGPPRIAFPNPSGSGNVLTSKGCLKGPFTTGIVKDGKDTGEGFTLAKLEANPTAFNTETHTESYSAGAVRGQFGQRMPVGGVDTGMGGTAGESVAAPRTVPGALVAGAGVFAMLGASGLRWATARRR